MSLIVFGELTSLIDFLELTSLILNGKLTLLIVEELKSFTYIEFVSLIVNEQFSLKRR